MFFEKSSKKECPCGKCGEASQSYIGYSKNGKNEYWEPEMDEEEFLEVLKSNPMFSREAITQLLATQKIPVSARVKENTKRMTKVARKAANNSPNTRRSWSTLRPREHE